jgi:hypothetical protein
VGKVARIPVEVLTNHVGWTASKYVSIHTGFVPKFCILMSIPGSFSFAAAMRYGPWSPARALLTNSRASSVQVSTRLRRHSSHYAPKALNIFLVASPMAAGWRFVGGIHSVYNVSFGTVINVFEFCLHLASFHDALVPFICILHGESRSKILDRGSTHLIFFFGGVVLVCVQGCLFNIQLAVA